MPPLPYSDPRHQVAHQFLVEEAHLLDTANFEAWLALMHPSISYRMPVRVTAMKSADEASVQTMDHYNEDLYALGKRVARFATDHAWAEDPPSRQRHHITNVRTFVAEGADGAEGLQVESGLLLYRSRGDRQPASTLSAGRVDTLVETDDGLRLADRLITVDESVLHTQNLAVFL